MSSATTATKRIITIHTEFKPVSLQLDNANLKVIKDKAVTTIPLNRILLIFVFGPITMTSNLLQDLKQARIGLFLFSISGRFITSLATSTNSYKLKKYQYTSSDIEPAKSLIRAKIQAQSGLLKHSNIPELEVSAYEQMIQQATTRETLMGIEGIAAKAYFGKLFDELDWYRRTPGKKPDIPNSLLDMGYMKLYYVIEGILQLTGYDPYVGFLHKPYYNRKSLITDFQEPFRPLIDSLVLDLFRSGGVNSLDFTYSEKGYQCSSWKAFNTYNNYFLKNLAGSLQEIHTYITTFQNTLELPADL